MEAVTIDRVVKLARQLSQDERAELIRQLEQIDLPRRRPSQSLRVFHVDEVSRELTLRREDEYGDDQR